MNMRYVKKLAFFLLYIYLFPSMASAAYWALGDHPNSWRDAKWTSAGILPDPSTSRGARIVVFAAGTGGFKGAFAVHSWLAFKRAGQDHYDRYEVVGWGQPVRKNAYAPDGFWYSNKPAVVFELDGVRAEALIPRIEDAIAAYPHNVRGGYTLWPGPNSNTFIASILRAVPQLDTVLPSNAVGRDYLAGGDFVQFDPVGKDLHVTIYGLAGFSIGMKSGLELDFMGLVAGFDFNRPGIKVPAFGRVGL